MLIVLNVSLAQAGTGAERISIESVTSHIRFLFRPKMAQLSCMQADSGASGMIALNHYILLSLFVSPLVARDRNENRARTNQGNVNFLRPFPTTCGVLGVAR